VTNPTPIPLLRCAICGEPIDLKTCKTDAQGRAVHGDCLVTKLTQPKPPKQQPRSRDAGGNGSTRKTAK